MQSEAVQDYVKQIHMLQARSDKPATTNEIAEKMGVSAAAATAMVKKLAELGLVEHRPYHGAQLTDAGNRVAVEVLRHHRLLELYLTEALGLPWDSVHVVSEELEAALDRALGYPDTDPHGDPIPGPDLTLPAETSRALLELEPGDDAVICRVPDDAPLLRYLASLGMVPEARVRMVDKAPFDGPVSLEVDGVEQSLGVAVAGRIRVGPV